MKNFAEFIIFVGIVTLPLTIPPTIDVIKAYSERKIRDLNSDLNVKK